MASLIPPHLQMEAQREEGRVALHLQSFVKGAWVGGGLDGHAPELRP